MDTDSSHMADPVLEQHVQLNGKLLFQEVWTISDRDECINWIKHYNLKNVCLQFPDSYLGFSQRITKSLRDAIDVRFYVLADTQYGNCCVDEISAAHVSGDGIIHFGGICSRNVSRIPLLCMSPKFYFSSKDLVTCLNKFEELLNGKKIFVYLSTGYHHVQNLFSTHFAKYNFNLHLLPLLNSTNEHETIAQDTLCIFIGADSEQFFNVSICSKNSLWYMYNPNSNTLLESDPLNAKFIFRRYFHIEKCKDAHTIGIIVATLTGAGYLEAVKRIQIMAQSRGIKTEIISVGRINQMKLSNFFEVDCFILVGCPCNNQYTIKGLPKPIVSVFEAELALNPAWRTVHLERYVTDFMEILPSGPLYKKFDTECEIEYDVSLISGCIRTIENKKDISAITDAISEVKKMTVTDPSLIYMNKGWRGLEADLGHTAPVKIQAGLSGVPTKYIEEK